MKDIENRFYSTSELRLADVVESDHGTFRVQVVKCIDENTVTFFRPYVHTEDFSWTGGVLCYVGIEEWKCPINDFRNLRLLERKELK